VLMKLQRSNEFVRGGAQAREFRGIFRSVFLYQACHPCFVVLSSVVCDILSVPNHILCSTSSF
jgi:hypothetical protein